MKQCKKCELIKSISDFHKHPTTRDRLDQICKFCRREVSKEYRDRLPRKAVLLKEKQSREEINSKAKLRMREKRKTPEYKEYNRKYQREYEKRRVANDAQYKIAKILRIRVGGIVKGKGKTGSAVRDLGCSVSELKVYLEERFKDGMSWNNHGEWHIDHIKPLSKFDLTNREQFLEACHYTNMQPLWSHDNLAKGNR